MQFMRPVHLLQSILLCWKNIFGPRALKTESGSKSSPTGTQPDRERRAGEFEVKSQDEVNREAIVALYVELRGQLELAKKFYALCRQRRLVEEALRYAEDKLASATAVVQDVRCCNLHFVCFRGMDIMCLSRELFTCGDCGLVRTQSSNSTSVTVNESIDTAKAELRRARDAQAALPPADSHQRGGSIARVFSEWEVLVLTNILTAAISIFQTESNDREGNSAVELVPYLQVRSPFCNEGGL